MTWKQWKEAVEAEGVKDDDIVIWIDTGQDVTEVEIEQEGDTRYVKVY